MWLRRSIRVAAVVSLVLGGFLLGVKFAPQCRDLKARLCGREFWRFDRYDLMVRMHKNWDQQLPAGATYFLGDSHVQRLFVGDIVDGGGVNVNYGIGSDTTWGLQARLNEYCSITNGNAFVIEIGCNDFIYHENRLERLNLDDDVVAEIIADLRYNETKSTYCTEECREIVEVLGHSVMYDYIYNTEEKLDIYKIQKLHKMLYRYAPFPEAGGAFRLDNNFVTGIFVHFAIILQISFSVTVSLNNLFFSTLFKASNSFSTLGISPCRNIAALSRSYLFSA